MKEKTCCFTGHRRLPKKKLDSIKERLDREIESIIGQGVTDFISGGALGFDQIAASLALAKRELGRDIRLILALPCHEQDKLWGEAQRRKYRDLLAQADEIVYVSEEYTNDCMRERNLYMVERSAYCVCALINSRSGTGQTVRLARDRGLRVVNVINQTPKT